MEETHLTWSELDKLIPGGLDSIPTMIGMMSMVAGTDIDSALIDVIVAALKTRMPLQATIVTPSTTYVISVK